MDSIDKIVDHGRVWKSTKSNKVRNGGQRKCKVGRPETELKEVQTKPNESRRNCYQGTDEDREARKGMMNAVIRAGQENNGCRENCQARGTRRDFETQLSEVETQAQSEGDEKWVTGASRANPSRINGCISCTVFRLQFEDLAGHRNWAIREKTTHSRTYLPSCRGRPPTFYRASIQKWCTKASLRCTWAAAGTTNWLRDAGPSWKLGPSWSASTWKSLQPPYGTWPLGPCRSP